MKKNSFFKNGIRILTGGRLFGGEPLLGKMVARQGILSLEDAVISGSLDVRDAVSASAFIGDGTNLILSSSQITEMGTLTVSGSILPETGNVFDLGSAADPWRDLYLSGSTLYLGNTKFTRNQDGDVELTDNQQVRKKIIVDSVELRKGDKTVILNVDSGSGQLTTLDSAGEPLVVTNGNFSGSFTGSYVGDGSTLTGLVNSINIPSSSENNQHSNELFNFDGSVGLRAGLGTKLFKDGNKIQIELSSNILESINTSSVNITGTTGNNLVIATSNSSLEGEASLSFDGDTLFVTGTVSASYFSGDGSGLYNIPVSRLTGSYKVFDFTEITASTFNHQLNTTHPLVQVYESSSGNQIVPEIVRAVDSSSVYISFGDFLTTGNVIIGAGGDVIEVTNNITNSYITGSDTVAASFSDTTQYSIVHNFGTENVIVSVYDQNKSYFLPSSITVTNSNQVDLTFNTAMTGYAVVAKAGHVVSGSVVAADWNGLYNIPAGLFSSSAQIVINESQISDLTHYTDSDVKTKLNTEGVISGSSQVNYTELQNIPSGLVSGSSQVNYTELQNIPSGLVSGSSQITEMGTLTISGSILPQTNEAFDLGSAQNRWRDLYLSGSTLYLGETKITRTSTGDIEFKDSNNNRKKLIADSIELRSNNRVVKLEVDSDGQLRTADTDNEQTVTTTGNFSGSFTGSFVGDGSQLSGVTSYTDSDTLSYINSVGVLSGSAQLTNLGNITLSGSIIPALDNTYDLGSPTKTWRDVYISSGSLYIDGTKVLSSTTDVLTITTDVGQSLKILESGADDITLQTDTGNIELKGTVELLSGKKILDSAGSQVVIGDNLNVEGNITLNGTVDGIDLQTFSSSVDTRIDNINTSLQSISTDFADITNKPTLISSSNQLAGETINGDLTISGILTAQEFRAEFVSSSIIFESGSTKFGNSADDVHQMTGSVCVDGAVNATCFVGDGSGLTGVTSYTDSDTLSYINSVGVVSGSSQIDYNSIQNKPTIPTNNSQLTNGCGYTTCTGTVTSVGGTGTVNGITLSGGVTSTGNLTLGGTLSGITVSQLDGGAVQTSAESFSDSNTVLMTAAAIQDKIESYGYCTTDTNTTYSAATMLTCIKSVDGASSGLDADLLDGNHASAFYLATNPSGYTTCTGTQTGTGTSGYISKWNGTSSQTNSLIYDNGTNVGIGTTSPSQKLQVEGVSGTAIGVKTPWSANAYGQLRFETGAGESSIRSYVPGNSTNGLQFFTYSGSETVKMTILGDGNVGIGTTSPSAKLHILSNGSIDNGAEIYLQHNNNNTTDVVSTIQFANNDGSVAMIQGGTTGANNTGYISFSTDNAGTSSEKMIITGAGNVGIGTTSPSSFSSYTTLSINSSIGGILNLMVNGSNALRIVSATDRTYLYEERNLPITISTNSTERMRVNADGNIVPGANGTQNLGSSTLRWNTVYTSDLSLKNDVGDWTIVEGEDDLFLYNNKRDKVYKFNLTEVDKETAPKKRS
jgi:hypothetical protein